MAKNNHSDTDSRRQLDRLLRTGTDDGDRTLKESVIAYARAVSQTEKSVVVVSDLADGSSSIFAGEFAEQLGLKDYGHENSIWEHKILSLMSAEEREAKYVAELRFFHHVRRLAKSVRPDIQLVTGLRMRFADGQERDVTHRMLYLYAANGETVRYAVCIYTPLPGGFKGKSLAVNAVTGIAEELTDTADAGILSRRQRQVLAMIDRGLKSGEIAAALNISLHTVSRHRQEIIARLRVRNSTEACRIAASMGII